MLKIVDALCMRSRSIILCRYNYTVSDLRGLLDIEISIVHLLQLVGHLEQFLLEVDSSGSGSTGVVPTLSHHLCHLPQQLWREGGRGRGREGREWREGRGGWVGEGQVIVKSYSGTSPIYPDTNGAEESVLT